MATLNGVDLLLSANKMQLTLPPAPFVTNIVQVDTPTFTPNGVIIADQQVIALYQQVIGAKIPMLVIVGGEQAKTLANATRIYKFFKANNVNRATTVYAIGGGTVCDLTAYCASTYMRGVKLELVPTTLLAMVDAAIGGKTALNLYGAKNLLGSFYPATRMQIYLPFLNSLPQSQVFNGWVEIVKVALIAPGPLYGFLANGSQEAGWQIIQKAIEVKASLCQQDLYDTGPRRFLNAGHTFAHVLEAVSNYKIEHGLAVALGLRAALRASIELGLPAADAAKIKELLDMYQFPAYPPQSLAKKVQTKGIELLTADKKRTSTHNFVLFKAWQEPYIYSCTNPAPLLKHLIKE